MTTNKIAIIGAGAAGLMAADRLTAAGHAVDVYDAMPSAGRKILMAGKSGLNLSHAEPMPQFRARYGEAASWMASMISEFGADQVRQWAADLGVETFIGTSGRIFPKEMKAAPLLRAWIRRSKDRGMHLHMRHRWIGFDEHGALQVESPDGIVSLQADVVLLATGGASWARLGSDGAWKLWLEKQGIAVPPFQPANCGFDCDWSDIMRDKFAGEPVKSVTLSAGDKSVFGDFVISQHGIEGSAVYAVSAILRDQLQATGKAMLIIDLAPGRDLNSLQQALQGKRGKKTLSNWLRSKAGLTPVKIALLRECLTAEQMQDMHMLAEMVKALPLPLLRPRPIDEAISTAGGIALGDVDDHLMLTARPGIFAAGEMLDWEAPTGGYLLTACFAQGWHAAGGMMTWMKNR